MFCANLLDAGDRDHPPRLLEMALYDREVRSLVEHARQNCTHPVQVSVIASEGRTEVRLEWVRRMGAFRVAGRRGSLGTILLDELLGSLGQPVPTSAAPCHVALHRNVVIWRRALIDTDDGLLFLYSEMPNYGHSKARCLVELGMRYQGDPRHEVLEFSIRPGTLPSSPWLLQRRNALALRAELGPQTGLRCG